MIDVHGVQHETLAAHHVVVVIGRKAHMKAIGGLGALPVPDVIRQYDEVLLNIENAAGNKQNIGKEGIQKRMRTASRAVQQQDGVIGLAGSITVRSAQCQVVQPQVRQCFARTEAKIIQHNRAVHSRPHMGWWRSGSLAGSAQPAKQQGRRNQSGTEGHARPPDFSP